MKRLILILLLLGIIPSNILAEEKTITLSVPGMNCPVCPITVRKSLEGVDGVTNAQVDYGSKSATVTYNDQQANPDSLMKATENVGYPSTIIK